MCETKGIISFRMTSAGLTPFELEKEKTLPKEKFNVMLTKHYQT